MIQAGESVTEDSDLYNLIGANSPGNAKVRIRALAMHNSDKCVVLSNEVAVIVHSLERRVVPGVREQDASGRSNQFSTGSNRSAR